MLRAYCVAVYQDGEIPTLTGEHELGLDSGIICASDDEAAGLRERNRFLSCHCEIVHQIVCSRNLCPKS